MTEPPEKIRVYLLDDHEVVRQGLRALLESAGDIEIVGESGSAADATSRIPALRPDVAVLDHRARRRPHRVRLDGPRRGRPWAVLDAMRGDAVAMLDRARERIAGRARLQASQRMDLLVLGAHQGGALSELKGGSVAVSILEHATCPVAIVPIARD